MRPLKLPPPSWPVWVVFALLLLPGVLVLGLLGGAKDAAAELLAGQEDAVGRNVVLTATLVEVETNAGLPMNSGVYEATIPASDGRGEQTVTLHGDDHWGFPPDPDHPEQLSFRVVLDDPPRGVAHGPVGSVEPVTEASVQAARNDLATAEGLRVAGIVVFWVFSLGLPALGVLLAVRRRRAKQAATGAGAPTPGGLVQPPLPPPLL